MKKIKNKKVKVIFVCVLIVVCVVALSAIGIKVKYNFENISCYGEMANSNPVLLVAHRGYSDVAPENTLASFEQAGLSNQFYGAECDVQLTKDGVWVIMHDNSVERTTNGTANVCDMTYNEISELTIDFGNGIKDYPNEKVPTFEQYLDVCKKYNLRPFIEIKMNANKQQVEDLYRIIENYGLAQTCTIISFFYDSLSFMREIDSNIEIFTLSSKINNDVINLCKEKNFGIDFCESKEQNTLKLLNSISDQGIPLAAWTVSSRSAYQRLTDNGIKIITCNSPEFSN